MYESKVFARVHGILVFSCSLGDAAVLWLYEALPLSTYD